MAPSHEPPPCMNRTRAWSRAWLYVVQVGVHPGRFQTCGFDYGRSVRNYERYGCANAGFWPPSMFAVGAVAGGREFKTP